MRVEYDHIFLASQPLQLTTTPGGLGFHGVDMGLVRVNYKFGGLSTSLSIEVQCALASVRADLKSGTVCGIPDGRPTPMPFPDTGAQRRLPASLIG